HVVDSIRRLEYLIGGGDRFMRGQIEGSLAASLIVEQLEHIVPGRRYGMTRGTIELAKNLGRGSLATPRMDGGGVARRVLDGREGKCERPGEGCDDGFDGPHRKAPEIVLVHGVQVACLPTRLARGRDSHGKARNIIGELLGADQSARPKLAFEECQASREAGAR